MIDIHYEYFKVWVEIFIVIKKRKLLFVVEVVVGVLLLSFKQGFWKDLILIGGERSLLQMGV